MKKIKKIAAGLMAAAITAAGMGSLTASANIQRKNITFPYSNKVCNTYVNYTPKRNYSAETYSIELDIVRRKVQCTAKTTTGYLYCQDGYSYNGSAYGGFYNIPSSINVVTFYSSHFATLNGVERSVSYAI